MKNPGNPVDSAYITSTKSPIFHPIPDPIPDREAGHRRTNSKPCLMWQALLMATTAQPTLSELAAAQDGSSCVRSDTTKRACTPARLAISRATSKHIARADRVQCDGNHPA